MFFDLTGLYFFDLIGLYMESGDPLIINLAMTDTLGDRLGRNARKGRT
jgi:hypothetical protein